MSRTRATIVTAIIGAIMIALLYAIGFAAETGRAHGQDGTPTPNGTIPMPPPETAATPTPTSTVVLTPVFCAAADPNYDICVPKPLPTASHTPPPTPESTPEGVLCPTPGASSTSCAPSQQHTFSWLPFLSWGDQS